MSYQKISVKKVGAYAVLILKQLFCRRIEKPNLFVWLRSNSILFHTIIKLSYNTSGSAICITFFLEHYQCKLTV